MSILQWNAIVLKKATFSTPLKKIASRFLSLSAVFYVHKTMLAASIENLKAEETEREIFAIFNYYYNYCYNNNKYYNNYNHYYYIQYNNNNNYYFIIDYVVTRFAPLSPICVCSSAGTVLQAGRLMNYERTTVPLLHWLLLITV